LVSYINDWLPKGFAETTGAEWQQGCRSAGIYLHILSFTITSRHWSARRTLSMREPSSWLVREKRKVRVLPRARVEPSGLTQEGIMNRRAIFTSTALKLAKSSVYFLSVSSFGLGLALTTAYALMAPEAPPIALRRSAESRPKVAV
jgi:hypothetical protein